MEDNCKGANPQLYVAFEPLRRPSRQEDGLLQPRGDDLNVLGVADLRAAESAAYAQMPSFTLMARAGEAAWQWAKQHCMGEPATAALRPWLILAGTGNNGGDAFVLARHAHQAGIPLSVYATGPTGDTATDAARARAELESAGIPVQPADSLTDIDPDAWACIIDGLLGIGARNPPAGETARLIHLINTASHPRTLALDIPSGLDADTGVASSPCVQASHTLSFIAAKPGLLTADGPDVCGETRIATLCLADAFARANSPVLALSDRSLLSLWPRRRLNSHKGTQGDVIIIGGDSGMAGAAILAGRAALQMGAGRVFVGLLDGPHPPGYDPVAPEMMLRPAESLSDHGGVWVIGPGAGQSDRMQILMRQLLRQWHEAPQTCPAGIVLDADALNLIAADPALAVRFQSLNARRIITPHPLEAARLLARNTAAVQADRLAAADALSRQLDAVIILKGMGTIISDGTQRCINLSGGPALASGGTGDVLAGSLGAILSQMKDQAAPAFRAAALATFLHGAACDAMPGEAQAPGLLCASELPSRMRQAMINAR